MTDVPQQPKPDWRFSAALGAAIAIGLRVSEAVEKNLEPSLGYWPVMLIGVLAAMVVAAIIAMVLLKLLSRKQ